MSAKPRKTKAAALDDRLDATPERLARAAEAGQETEKVAGAARRLVDPFDVMRTTRALAPHDPKLNDLRWLIGEALRRIHDRARLDSLRAVALERVGTGGFGPRSGLPLSEIALHARDKIRAARGARRPGRLAGGQPHRPAKAPACANAAPSCPRSSRRGGPTPW